LRQRLTKQAREHLPILAIVLIVIFTPLAVLAIFAVGYFLRGMVDMWRYRNYHTFPAYGRCMVCQKRLFVWQKVDVRNWVVLLQEGFRIGIISFDGVAHRKCEGDPPVETVKELVGW
jgi:hypothetical protein